VYPIKIYFLFFLYNEHISMKGVKMKMILISLIGILMFLSPLIASADYPESTYSPNSLRNTQRCMQSPNDTSHTQLPDGQSYDPSIQGYETPPSCTNYSQAQPGMQQSVVVNNYLQPAPSAAQQQMPPPPPKKPNLFTQIAQGLILSKIFSFPVAFNFGL
jgi:hypothetical protein